MSRFTPPAPRRACFAKMASFTLAESPISPFGSSRNGSLRDWEEFANVLLEDGFILTALELHTELLEYGKESPTLRDYFSNPGNFEHAIPQPPSSGLLGSDIIRSSSMSTFDSIELGRYSDDSNRDNEDRVAVLEFELRKAFETIKSLRGSLTEATEIGPTKDGEVAAKVKTKSDDPIKPHEKRALNFLTHEYLMQQDNKLTAITFTEENGDQDFDDWDDVGLNIPKPPDLLYLFRNYSTCMLSDKEKVDRIQQLEDQVAKVTGQNLALKRENEALNLRLRKISLPGMGSPQLHRRGSSFTEKSNREIAESLAVMKKHGHARNRSSPENPPTTATLERPQNHAKETTEAVKLEGDARRKSDPDADSSSNKLKELSHSMTSSTSVISAKSDVTLSAEDDAETLVNEDAEKSKQSETEEDWEMRRRGDTLTPRERSESSTTLQKEDEDLEEDEEDEDEGGVKEEVGYRMSVAFRQKLLDTIQLKTDSRIGLEVVKLADPGVDIIQLLGRCLPHVVPNVILAKREELIPILLCVVSKHPNSKTRDQLLHMMFNLIKRPDKKQRQVIMSGCVAFAKLNGSTQVESELLPQMWEQITHKYYERRLLVAESCGVLAPYIPPELRGSLVLSMLTQMLEEDKAESVRQAVARALAIIVAFTDDEDKFKQCWELVLKALADPSQLVVSATNFTLLPSLAAWALELGVLERDVLSYFLHQLLTCIKQVSRSDGESGAVEQSQHHLFTLTHLIPWHYAAILLTSPFADITVDSSEKHKVILPQPHTPLLDVRVIVGDEARLGSLVARFEREVGSEDFTPWKSLEWFCKEYLNRLLKVSVALGFSQCELMHSIATLLATYCTYLGYTFTHKVIRPFFESTLALPKQNPASALADGRAHLATPVLPIYVSGVLATFSKDEKLLVSFLRSAIVDMALYFGPSESLKATFQELKREKRHHTLLLGVLQDLVTHSSFQVRRYTTILFGLMVRKVDEKLVMKVILPHLIKLARDSEMAVRIDTIESFGAIMESVTSKDILVRVHEQFESFMDQEQYRVDHQVLMAVLATLAKIGPHADPVFRDEFIIPRLADVSIENNKADNETKRRDVALALLEAYKNISECFVAAELVTTFMIPGLQSLSRDMEAVEPEQVPAVQQLITSCQSKAQEHKRHSSHSSEGKSGTFLSKLVPQDLSPTKLFRKKS